METVKDIRQKLFNKAVEGLKSQGFERCVNESGNCVYNMRVGDQMRHCAFGWIADVPNDYNSGYTADELLDSAYGRTYGISNIAELRGAGIEFNKQLQMAHDESGPKYTYDAFGDRDGIELSGPARMWDNLTAFATKYDLDASMLGDRPA